MIIIIMNDAFMAEWSKATDSSSVLYGGVGSNPTRCNHIYIYYIIIIIIYDMIYIM